MGDDDFTLEGMDEQISQVEQALMTPHQGHTANMELLHDLHRFYRHETRDAQSVEHVWEHMVSTLGDQNMALPSKGSADQVGAERRAVSLFPPRGRRSGRYLTLVAAALLVMIVSANVIIVLHLTQQNQKGSVANNVSNFPRTRNPLQWPFAQNSIWNMPVGSKAVYVPANLKAASVTSADEDYFIITKATDPLRPLYIPGAWGVGRCTGTQKLSTIRIPDNVVVPDSTPGSTPSNASAFLQPDGRTLLQIEPLARCTPGGDVYGYRACAHGEDQDIEGDGICGAYFGSGLSSIGGMLRLGELTGSQLIHHALQLGIWMEAYGYYSRQVPGYRWPASQADNGAQQHYCSLDPCKSHPNSSLMQGSLLALPPSITPEQLGLTTVAGKKLFQALQDYGGYTVNDAGWNSFQIGVEKGVPAEFSRSYGVPFGAGDFHNDVNKLFQALQVINNNGSTSIGGGGTPRAPLAPPFSNHESIVP